VAEAGRKPGNVTHAIASASGIGGVETGRFRAHIQSMADGWNIITTRPDPAGGPDLRGAFVVRVSDRLTAIAVVQSKMPDAMVQIDSETSPEVFEKYDMMLGEALLLVEGK
jgi:hypothetical protein